MVRGPCGISLYLETPLAPDVEVFCWPSYGAFFPPQGHAPDPREATIKTGSELAGLAGPANAAPCPQISQSQGFWWW